MRVPAFALVLLPAFAVPAGTWAGEEEPPTDGAHPELVVTESEIDLGTIREGAKVEVTYLRETHGQAALIIDRIKGDCGCM
ncbi:MAG: DUF1573 domain-containing protein, partial [bacterium]|nr:DUF1573 domain-containing protein [bacterium]